jgi:transcriptional regulator with XRE-family HTH domain
MRALDVASRIRKVRQALGLTQAQFGQRIGVIKVSVARYEAGRLPRMNVLDSIARLGGVTIEWLLHGPGPETDRRLPRSEVPEPKLPAPLRDLAVVLERAAPRLAGLPRQYRKRYEERVAEVIGRVKRELEEYQKVLEAEHRAKPAKRKTRSTRGAQ